MRVRTAKHVTHLAVRTPVLSSSHEWNPSTVLAWSAVQHILMDRGKQVCLARGRVRTARFLDQFLGIWSRREGEVRPLYREFKFREVIRKSEREKVIKHRQETRRIAKAHASRQIIQGNAMEPGLRREIIQETEAPCQKDLCRRNFVILWKDSIRSVVGNSRAKLCVS